MSATGSLLPVLGGQNGTASMEQRRTDEWWAQQAQRYLTVDPRTGRIPLSSLRKFVNDAFRTRYHGSSPGIHRAHQRLPVELWTEVFRHLQRQDLLVLARTCKYVGAIAEEGVYRKTNVYTETFAPWTRALATSPYRANAVRSLTLSYASGPARLAGLVMHLEAVLPSLSNLRELTLTGMTKLPRTMTRDILGACTFRTLIKFHCDSDALVLASWASLKMQIALEEFRGLFSITDGLHSSISPMVFPALRVLDSGAPFVSRLNCASRVTHLSVHAPRATAALILQRMTRMLGHQLVALRVVRTILAPYSAGEASTVWGTDSPVALCAVLDAPALRLFEVRDRAAAGQRWSADFETLRDMPAYSQRFRTAQRTTRTPSLAFLLWRPVWAGSARLFKTIALDYLADFFALLPVRLVALPLVEKMQKPGHTEGWSIWGRVAVEPDTPRVEWWDGEGTFRQANTYVPLEDMWAIV